LNFKYSTEREILMKIVVLDGYTLNPGDLSWEELAKIGELTIYDRTPPDQIIPRAGGAEIILTNKTVLAEDSLSRLPDVKYIGLLATGYNTVDVAFAAKHGITVTNVPAYSTPSVAQLTFALLLEICNHVQIHSDTVRNGEWSAAKDFSYWKFPLIELSGKTMGIIGFGQIGSKVAEIAYAFGLNVIAHTLSPDEGYSHDNFKWSGLDGLLAESDIVSLHCPLFPETQEMVNASFLGKMKQTALLLNTSRGGLVNDQHLADALNSGRIAGAGLDVISTEPPSADNPLLTAKNCIITPHIAWASKESRSRLMDAIVENLKCFLAKAPINVVS
jgi:glycerate dehydrogenase